ncbi:MAG TPA: hypothetical protein VMN35_08475 [Gaiellaceae bacterium]|nr:hypothetical protein [Gaiellaceae bacterium]
MRIVAVVDTSVIVVTGEEAVSFAGIPPARDDSPLYLPARLYDRARDELSDEVWLGSILKFVGGHFEEPRLDPAEEERVLARVAALREDA